MRAAWYTKTGKAAALLQVGWIEEIETLPDELQIEMYYSGINPGEIHKQIFEPGGPMTYPIIIPHSDGAGIVKKTGENVSKSWIGKKVLCFGAQSYRAFGTAAEYCSVPVSNVIELGETTPLTQAAQMGIPAMTGHRAVHLLNNLKDKIVLVQGGAGAVAQCAIQFAKRAGAKVIATVNKPEDMELPIKAGASEVFIITPKFISTLKDRYPAGIDHIVEVSFAQNLAMDLELLKNGGSIATYSGSSQVVQIPFWNLIFENISFHFLGSDDFAIEDKRTAMKEAVSALDDGWEGLEIAKVFKLDEIVEAHQYIANRRSTKRVLINLKD